MSTDKILHLLSNQRRRYTIEYLGSHGPTNFPDLVDRVAARELDTNPESVSGQERNRVRVSLYQTHLDALRDNHVIEFERKSGLIHPGPGLDRLLAVLDRVYGRDRGWLERTLHSMESAMAAL